MRTTYKWSNHSWGSLPSSPGRPGVQGPVAPARPLCSAPPTTVTLDAGVPIQELTVANHQAQITRDGKSKAAVMLSSADSLPNKDFVLRYGVVLVNRLSRHRPRLAIRD